MPRGPDGETFSGFHPDGETCCWWHSRQEEEGNSAASSRQVVTPTGKHIGGFPPECFPVGVTLYGTVVHPDGETSRKLDGETFAQRGNMSSTGKHMQQMFPRRGQEFGPDGETFEHVSPSSLSAPPRRGNICSTGTHFGPRPRRGNIWWIAFTTPTGKHSGPKCFPVGADPPTGKHFLFMAPTGKHFGANRAKRQRNVSPSGRHLPG